MDSFNPAALPRHEARASAPPSGALLASTRWGQSPGSQEESPGEGFMVSTQGEDGLFATMDHSIFGPQ